MPTLRTALPVARLGCAGAERLTIERILHDEPGVLEVVVNPVTEMAYVEYEPAVTEPDALFAVLQRAGFTPRDRVAVRRARPTTGRGPLDLVTEGDAPCGWHGPARDSPAVEA